MKIAIHAAERSWSDGWVAACKKRGIEPHIVDCAHTDIIAQVQGCDGLMWHVDHTVSAARLAGIPVLTALSAAGFPVYPDPPTVWHFDNKLAQKYLLEAIGAPIAKTWAFFDEQTAQRFLDSATYPLVFKLRKGAGSANVRLVEDAAAGKKLAKQAFSEGFVASESYFDEVGKKLGRIGSPEELLGKIKRAPAAIKRNLHAAKAQDRERGYMLLQEFLPNATHDTRISVIGDRAFGFIRGVRPDDFRASGSGKIDFDPSKVDPRCVQLAFQTSEKLGCQSMAYDFVMDQAGEPKMLEVCFGYLASAVHACPGHWRRDGSWVEGQMWPQDASVEDFAKRIEGRKNR